MRAFYNCISELSRKLPRSVKTILVVLVLSLVTYQRLPREPLDRLWDEHMLTGTWTSGIYSDGDRILDRAENSFEADKGSPMQAWLTKEGISIGGHRETSLFFLLVRGGWSMFGGLLAKVEKGESTFELYGKVIDRALPKPFFRIHFGIPGGFGYEFFFLHRQKGVKGSDKKTMDPRPIGCFKTYIFGLAS